MAKIHLYIIGLFFFAGCSATTNDFEKYTSQINTLPTPITFRTIEFSDNKAPDNIDEVLFDKYKYTDANNVYGKIYESKKFVAIIYTVNGDVLVPVLVTYDKNGNKKDSLNLFDNASGLNLQSETYVTSTFYSNKTIQEIDSISTWALNDRGDDRLPGSEKIKVDSIKYTITDSGKIITNKRG